MHHILHKKPDNADGEAHKRKHQNEIGGLGKPFGKSNESALDPVDRRIGADFSLNIGAS